MTPAEIVRQRLLDAGVNATDLASAIGLERGSARLMLRGKRGIPAKHYPKIAERLGISLAELVRTEEITDQSRVFVPRDETEREVFDMLRRVTEPRTRLFIRDMVARVIDEWQSTATDTTAPRRTTRMRGKFVKKAPH